MRDHGGVQDFCSRRQPRFVGLELDAKLVVIDAKITVAALRDGSRQPACTSCAITPTEVLSLPL